MSAVVLIAAAAGGLLAVGVREAIAATPALAGWLRGSVEPLARAGREGYAPDAGERRRLALVGTGAILAAATLLAGPGPLALAAAAGPPAAAWAVGRRRARYRHAVERGMPEVAVAVADGISAGRSVRGALASAAESLRGPPGAELARLAAELELGVSTGSALVQMRARLGSERVDAFAAALIGQQVAGGDVSTLLRRFAEGAGDRDRTADDARAATAQARFTGMLVVALPGGTALFAELLEPGFIGRVLGDATGIVMVAMAGCLQLAGFALISRLGKSRE
jgi:tight adherence protein B